MLAFVGGRRERDRRPDGSGLNERSAFRAPSITRVSRWAPKDAEQKRRELEARGIPVSPQLVDLDWVKNFFAVDPVNGIRSVLLPGA